MLQDFRYGLRMLWKSPAFTLVAVLALALGIGANTSIFSVVNAVLLRPLPFAKPDRLVMVWEHSPRTGKTNVANPINFLEWRARNHSFERIAALVQVPFNLSGDGEPEQVQGMLVSDGYFEILGAQAMLGRTFTPEEDGRGHDRVVILSQGLWQRRYGSDPKILGRAITVNNGTLTVVGVMPSGFRFPDTKAELWSPMAIDRAPAMRTGRYLWTVARLKPGASIGSAQADMDVIAKELERERPDFDAKWGITVVSLREQAVGEVRPALLILLGSVGFVLLIACANVANLMLIRAGARGREIAIRASLGAARWRIVRQLLVESLTLAAAGGTLGLMIAVWLTDALVAAMPESISIYNVTAVSLDRNVLLFTLALSVLTGVLFGVAPALGASRVDLHDALKEGARGSGGGRSGLRSALVVVEVALSVVLLIGAGLLIRSFLRLAAVSPGFEPEKTLTMRMTLFGSAYRTDQKVVDFTQQILERVRRLPQVRAAGTIHFLPLSGLLSATGFWVDGRPTPQHGDEPVAVTLVITPGYFSAMGVPLIRGRTFTERDRDGAPLTVIVNQALARKYFPNENPVGRRLFIQWGRKTPYEIVGVVGDVRHRGLEREPEPTLFLSDFQEPNGLVSLVVRTAGDPMQVAATIEKEIHSVDPVLPISEVRTMDYYLSSSVSKPRFNTLLLGSFAGLALLLAAIGIFGVISYSVAQRTHEIGIRVALGASGGSVVSMVLRQGLFLTLAGVALGLAGAFALTRLLATLLFGVTATDPITFAAVAVVLGAVALVSSYIPARRATKVDPTVALRYE